MKRYDFNQLTEKELIELINSEIEFDTAGNDGNGFNKEDILTMKRSEMYNHIYGG